MIDKMFDANLIAMIDSRADMLVAIDVVAGHRFLELAEAERTVIELAEAERTLVEQVEIERMLVGRAGLERMLVEQVEFGHKLVARTEVEHKLLVAEHTLFVVERILLERPVAGNMHLVVEMDLLVGIALVRRVVEPVTELFAGKLDRKINHQANCMSFLELNKPKRLKLFKKKKKSRKYFKRKHTHNKCI